MSRRVSTKPRTSTIRQKHGSFPSSRSGSSAPARTDTWGISTGVISFTPRERNAPGTSGSTTWAPTGELNELRVRCECGASRFISEAAGKNNPVLGGCDSSQQWLGPAAVPDERCTESSRLLIRTASNAYFPQKLSVISMPDRGQALHAAVGRIWDSHLQAVHDRALLTVFKTIPASRGNSGRLRR